MMMAGIYSSYLFGEGKRGAAPSQRVIMLDTRFHRDNHVIPSLAAIKLPLMSLVAATVRCVCVVWEGVCASVFVSVGVFNIARGSNMCVCVCV